MSSKYPTIVEAMLNKTDGAGWRSMDCAPRRPDDADPFETPERILARTEGGEDVMVVWSIPSEDGPNGWCRIEGAKTAVKERLVAWRPIPQINEPDERIVARSLAHICGEDAEKAERMARFLPQEKERGERLRAEQAKHLEIANRRR